MPQISFLHPSDQPPAKYRIINDLIVCLQSPIYSHFALAVGFAKVGPLLRLLPHLRKWKDQGKTVEAIFGIDHNGTSLQALGLALGLCNRTYVTHIPNGRVTFHPKMYLFSGEKHATYFCGSHNLTVGGTETNFEAGVKVEFDRTDPRDEVSFQEVTESWLSLLPDRCTATCELDEVLLGRYLQAGLLLDEAIVPQRRNKPPADALSPSNPNNSEVSKYWAKPPSSIPKDVIEEFRPKKVKTKDKTTSRNQSLTAIVKRVTRVPTGQTLVIQILPHRNGEIFLSTAIFEQNPDFFGEFAGRTKPKKASNSPYLQKVPDPVVNIRVFDQSGQVVPELSRESFDLNTIFYERKRDLRVTVEPEIARAIPSYSVLVMTKTLSEGQQDFYDMDIYFPNSQQYNDYLSSCNQKLPKGSASAARMMGWL